MTTTHTPNLKINITPVTNGTEFVIFDNLGSVDFTVVKVTETGISTILNALESATEASEARKIVRKVAARKGVKA